MGRKICHLAKKDKVLSLNSGTEAVEAAIKIARKWGSEVKGITDGQVEIIAMNNNFHKVVHLAHYHYLTTTHIKQDFTPYFKALQL
ncbi:aminotransferase class III-fold pyridoxal phosphate-dependent enzyme [Staphylococcus aureus]